MRNNKKTYVSVAIAGLLTLILAGGWLALHLQLRQVQQNFKDFTQNISEEVENRQSTLERIGLNQNILFSKLNESREALQLPRTEAIPLQTENGLPDSGSSESAARQGTGENTGDALFFRGVEYFDEYYRLQELERRLTAYIDNQRLHNSLTELKLNLQQNSRRRYSLTKNGERLFILDTLYIKESPQLRVSSRLHREKTFSMGKVDRTVEESTNFIKNELTEIEAHANLFTQKIQYVRDLFQSTQVSQLLREKRLKLLSPEQPAGQAMSTAEWRIRTAGTNGSDGGWIFNFGVRFQDNRYFIEEQSYEEQADFRAALLEQLQQIDARTPQQRDVAAMIEELSSLSKDEAFHAFLAENNLEMKSEPREDGDYYYFDLYHEDSRHYGAFAVLKKHGKVYLTDSEDVVISELKTITSDNRISSRAGKELFPTEVKPDTAIQELPKASSISTAGNSKETLILLCGTHEQNADTMMIARLSKDTGIRLLSIPRDIYYKQRKVSDYYRLYGIEKLRSVVEELTGVEFDGHITVDMYAFIDVVNILDGINVYLDKALIDPTYRIREHGEWKTLYFKAGEHHLTGIEALRIARSRHTSDDFDRAYRQQLVIKALFTKLNSLHAGNLQEVYNLFKVLYEYVDTDFSAYDLAQFFLKYHNADLQPRKSISTDNILYTTYSNYYLSGLTEEEVDDDFYKGAWILLPKQNDWELIPRFVYQQLYTE
ncbi:MAG: LCP family protein [Spirochaetaceae bacterium]|nr:LCP family protein [Spirochaetaceae bacterium]MCF7948182.1 LCP family protein [Spirochaetia bacterium]MCF7950798.1 LCP family protein [Spirochaetaceae bacterium]